MREKTIWGACATPDCGNRIRKDNSTGLCKPCAKPLVMAINYERNREKRLAVAKTAYEANRELRNIQSRALYAANREERLAWQKAYQEANPDVARRSRVSRRARLKGAFVEHVSPAVAWERDGGICHICQLPADPSDWHLEHVIPLARGGEHSYANIAVSHPACNMRKGSK